MKKMRKMVKPVRHKTLPNLLKLNPRKVRNLAPTIELWVHLNIVCNSSERKNYETFFSEWAVLKNDLKVSVNRQKPMAELRFTMLYHCIHWKMLF